MKRTVYFLVGSSLMYSPSILKSQKITPEKKMVKDIESVRVQGKTNYNYANISRKKLDFIQSNTLGETLSKIPGIQNSGYGPNSGAPLSEALAEIV